MQRVVFEKTNFLVMDEFIEAHRLLVEQANLVLILVDMIMNWDLPKSFNSLNLEELDHPILEVLDKVD